MNIKFYILAAAIFYCYTLTAQTWQIGYPNNADVTATLDANGTMIVSGTGAMQDFANYNSAPWFSVNYTIIRITIQNGITNIGDNALVLLNIYR